MIHSMMHLLTCETKYRILYFSLFSAVDAIHYISLWACRRYAGERVGEDTTRRGGGVGEKIYI